MWTKKKRGWSTIWIHPQLPNAVVDTNGFGMDDRISYREHRFDSVKEAKRFAEKESHEQTNS